MLYFWICQYELRGVAPQLSKSIHPRKFGNHVIVHRDHPTDRPSAPQAYQCKISAGQWQFFFFWRENEWPPAFCDTLTTQKITEVNSEEKEYIPHKKKNKKKQKKNNSLLLDLSIWTTVIEQNYIIDLSKKLYR